MAAGVAAGQPRSSSRRAIAARRPSPMRTTIVAPDGSSAPTADANTSSSWPLTTSTAADRPRCVTGMPASGRRRERAGDARHDVERHAGRLQRERFFTAAAEHERIAALQPDHAAAAFRRADHDGMNVVLRQRVAAGALADEEALRAAGELAGCVRRRARRRGPDRPRAAGRRPSASGDPDRRVRRRPARHGPSSIALRGRRLLTIQIVQRREQQRLARTHRHLLLLPDCPRRGAPRPSTGRCRAAGWRPPPRG